MQTIFALMICLTHTTNPLDQANGCTPPENGWIIFDTAEECQRVADRTNRNNPLRPGQVYKIEERCFQKSVNTSWSPVPR